jgi:hypothetical protein
VGSEPLVVGIRFHSSSEHDEFISLLKNETHPDAVIRSLLFCMFNFFNVVLFVKDLQL